MVIAIIAGVFAVSALIGFAAWRFIKSTEATLANPAKLRRQFIVLAAIYCIGIVSGITQVIEGRAPAYGLVGLPIGLYFVWTYLRAAAQLKKSAK